ncbi:MAG: hypothetical protein M9933_09320 [Chitinophagaceae bacterium]|nr:hypothetical protein [Chitinophagaceae bacterium]
MKDLFTSFIIFLFLPGLIGCLPVKRNESVTFPTESTGFRGVFFNPYLKTTPSPEHPYAIFLRYDKAYRAEVKEALNDLAKDAGINLVSLFIPIPLTLKKAATAPPAAKPNTILTNDDLDYYNTAFLDGIALFIDDCYEAGLSVELDLADNRWVSYAINPDQRKVGYEGEPYWPIADDTPWDESARWYSDVIIYIEGKTKHPENIALWTMTGNYLLGTAEPDLWSPEVSEVTEQYVKQVWPVFAKAGKRPKGTPVLLPIYANDPYWNQKTSDERLAAFVNIKKWLVDDMQLPPDYWVMTTYPFTDPGSDGIKYIERIVNIIGKENASRIISTDLKGPGHEEELSTTIFDYSKYSPAELLEWQLKLCKAYGFAGWWIWSYQGTADDNTGIRKANGEWKTELVDVIKKYLP